MSSSSESNDELRTTQGLSYTRFTQSIEEVGEAAAADLSTAYAELLERALHNTTFQDQLGHLLSLPETHPWLLAPANPIHVDNHLLPPHHAHGLDHPPLYNFSNSGSDSEGDNLQRALTEQLNQFFPSSAATPPSPQKPVGPISLDPPASSSKDEPKSEGKKSRRRSSREHIASSSNDVARRSRSDSSSSSSSSSNRSSKSSRSSEDSSARRRRRKRRSSDGKKEQPTQIDAQQAAEETSTSSSSASGPFSCPVCYDDEVPADEIRGLLSCSHRVCATCMDRHLSISITDGNTDKLKCPDPQCMAVPAEYEVENLVSKETYEKYLQFAVLEGLKKDTNLRWCPNKKCGQPISCDGYEKDVTCPSCQQQFCFQCRKPWEADHFCQPESAEADGQQDKAMKGWLKKKKNKVKACPRCHTGIEKNEGCNHITCGSCQYQFCWVCRGAYTPVHFSEGACQGLQFAHIDSLDEMSSHRRRNFCKKVCFITLGIPLVIIGGVVLLVGAVIIGLPYLCIRACTHKNYK